jgi:hypothetical protein
MATRRIKESPSHVKQRNAILHTNLLLVRSQTVEQMDAILSTAPIKHALVRRLVPNEAIFRGSMLRKVLQRMEATDIPFAFEDLGMEPVDPGGREHA